VNESEKKSIILRRLGSLSKHHFYLIKVEELKEICVKALQK
jgi:hypothetical protein